MSGNISGNLLGGIKSNSIAPNQIRPSIRSGGVVYHPNYAQGTFIATIAVVANVLYTAPLSIINTRNVPVRGLQLISGTPVLGVLGRMMLFAADENGEPGNLIANTTTNVDMNAAGATPLPADFASDVILPTGLYYPAAVFDGAAQPWTFNPGAPQGNGITVVLGVTDLRGVVAAGNATRVFSRISAPSAFGVAPSTFPSFTYGTSNPGAPIMGIVTR